MKSKLSVLMLSMLVCIAGCQTVSPDAGQEAVLIEKPIIFGHGGIVPNPITTGRTYVALTTSVVYVNMQPCQFPEHFEDLMSLDGVPLDFDAVVRLQTTDSVGLVKNFGEKWYENNVSAEFKNRVRQAVRKHGMNETAIDTKAIDQIDNEITAAMEQYITSAGLPVKLIQITVGKANPPDSIKNQRVATATEQQRALTEKQRKLAEDSRFQAEESRAAADNAYRVAMSLSPEQFLQLETIKMWEKVGATGHCTFLVSTGASELNSSGVTPVLNVENK